MTEDEFDKKWGKVYVERTDNSHNIPSPETKVRLIALETSQKFMSQEISEIKELVKGLDKKLDDAIDKKADKSVVDDLMKKFDIINSWMWKVIGISIVGVIVFGTLATLLINHLLK